MKKSISIFLCCFLIFSSTIPSFAAYTPADPVRLTDFYDDDTGNYINSYTWVNSVSSVLSTISSRISTTNSRLSTIITALTDNSNSYILSNMLIQIQKLTHLADQIDFFLGSNGTTTITQNWSEFTADMYKLVRFLAPINSNIPGSGNSFMTLWDYVFYEAGMINQLWGGWDNYFSHLPVLPTFMNANHADLDKLQLALTNYYRGRNSSTQWTFAEMRNNGHSSLFASDANGSYTYPQIYANGTYGLTDQSTFWQYGSPIGNIAFLLREQMKNDARIFGTRFSADLTGYNATLSIWDSQGNTLTQETWVPQSAINGLYKYLAYTQRDVARLTHVLASDEEIEARDLASANQEAVVDNFIDSTGSGAVSTTDFEDISDLSSGYKAAFSSDASPTGIFDIFNSNNMGWFSQETRNQLDNTSSTRKGNNFETPLLDQQIEDIYNSLGVKQP